MKKICLSIFIIIFACNLSHAQWTISGNNIFNNNTGNVGIGTTTPQSLLDVKGGLAVGTFAGSTAAPINGLSVSGKASFGISTPTPISSGAPMFPSVTPNMEILTGTATGTYQELVTIRHTGVDPTLVSRRLGLLLELSHEGSVGESGKNGGMVLEASAAYANYPSLSLVTGSTDRLTVTSDGKVGIGTTSPVNNFQVTSASTGTIGLSGAAGTVRDYIFQTAGVSKWALRTDGTAESGANAGSDFNIVGRDDAGALLGTYLYIKRSNGNIGIGTTNPYTYKLAINGSAIATAMWVKNFANWPDYVFKTDYKLPALNDLKTYIDKNHHLPDVPTEKEVKQNGLNLGEMNKVLVKKVEELTLYMIDKDRQLAAQQAEINDMKRQMEAIEKKLANK